MHAGQDDEAMTLLKRINSIPSHLLVPYSATEAPSPLGAHCRIHEYSSTGEKVTIWVSQAITRDTMNITIFEGWRVVVQVPIPDWTAMTYDADDVKRAALIGMGKQLVGDRSIFVAIDVPLPEEADEDKENKAPPLVEVEEIRPNAPEPLSPMSSMYSFSTIAATAEDGHEALEEPRIFDDSSLGCGAPTIPRTPTDVSPHGFHDVRNVVRSPLLVRRAWWRRIRMPRVPRTIPRIYRWVRAVL